MWTNYIKIKWCPSFLDILDFCEKKKRSNQIRFEFQIVRHENDNNKLPQAANCQPFSFIGHVDAGILEFHCTMHAVCELMDFNLKVFHVEHWCAQAVALPTTICMIFHSPDLLPSNSDFQPQCRNLSCVLYSSLLTSHLAGPVSGLEALMLPDVATESISCLTFGWLSPACSQVTWASSEIQCSESLRTSRRDHSPLGHGSPCWPPHRQRFVDGRWCSHQWNRQQVQCTTGTRWQPRKEHGMLHMILTASG